MSETKDRSALAASALARSRSGVSSATKMGLDMVQMASGGKSVEEDGAGAAMAGAGAAAAGRGSASGSARRSAMVRSAADSR